MINENTLINSKLKRVKIDDEHYKPVYELFSAQLYIRLSELNSELPPFPLHLLINRGNKMPEFECTQFKDIKYYEI